MVYPKVTPLYAYQSLEEKWKFNWKYWKAHLWQNVLNFGGDHEGVSGKPCVLSFQIPGRSRVLSDTCIMQNCVKALGMFIVRE